MLRCGLCSRKIRGSDDLTAEEEKKFRKLRGTIYCYDCSEWLWAPVENEDMEHYLRSYLKLSIHIVQNIMGW